MAWWTKLTGALFGNSDKGIVTEVSDAVDKWIPSETSKHNMSIEDEKAGDDSQASARQMQMVSHSSWFDIAVDGANRLVRPIITGWVICILFGWIKDPTYLSTLSPVAANIVWTVITFWFGSRMIFKDIPTMIRHIKR